MYFFIGHFFIQHVQNITASPFWTERQGGGVGGGVRVRGRGQVVLVSHTCCAFLNYIYLFPHFTHSRFQRPHRKRCVVLKVTKKSKSLQKRILSLECGPSG